MSLHEFIDGELNILVSAPHAFAHKRPNLTDVSKRGEDRTDQLVRQICKSSRTPGMVATENLQFDPNFHPEQLNPYKLAIRDFVAKHKVKGLIDLHGLNDRHLYDVGIYFTRRFRKSKEIAHNVRQALSAGSLSGLSAHLFNFGEGEWETITQFCSRELKIPAIQIEIARYIREDPMLLDEFASSLSRFISTVVF